jgi:polar amino acid transport system permease protein
MNQTPAERLEAERKLSENQFDITQYEHVPRRYYGRMFFATLIVIVLAALLRAFANGQIEWSYIGQFLTSEAIIWGLVNTIVMSTHRPPLSIFSSWLTRRRQAFVSLG